MTFGHLAVEITIWPWKPGMAVETDLAVKCRENGNFHAVEKTPWQFPSQCHENGSFHAVEKTPWQFPSQRCDTP